MLSIYWTGIIILGVCSWPADHYPYVKPKRQECQIINKCHVSEHNLDWTFCRLNNFIIYEVNEVDGYCTNKAANSGLVAIGTC